MGNLPSLRRSKSYAEVHETLSPEPVSGAGAPAETPKCPHIMSLIDPRSPNVEISRTPILAEEEAKVKAKKRTIQEFMEREAMKTPPPEEEETRNSDADLLFDPRSPTQEISRTPICVQENENLVNPNLGLALSESTAENARFDDSGEVLKAARKNFDYDMGSVTGQMCRDLRKRLFITQKLNASDSELLNIEAEEETDKENQLAL